MAPESPVASPEELVRGASALVIDSRAATDGSIFVALHGFHTDGHAFIDDAIRRGARVGVMEEERALPPGVRGVVVADSSRMLSRLANAFYGAPAAARKMIGITGTNGKTTAAAMLGAILNAAGIPCAVAGTLGASFAGKVWPLGNTTPLAHELHGMLAQMRARGAAAVAMEVSSHALALQRVADIHFAVAALTNISRDHLDFHNTFEAYADAKRSLFGMADAAVLNADDPFGRTWAQEGVAPRIVRYSIGEPADVTALDVRLHADRTTFAVGAQHFCLPIPGRFNVANALAAIACAREMGVDDAVSAGALENLTQVRGRMEYVHGGGVHVVIDYAHTPDALENILRTLRETAVQRLTVVFGCGGDRDRGKRAEMGRIAARIADRIVITNDNPRTEDPRCIAEDILGGVGERAYTLTLDRHTAIHDAIRTAEHDEIVLIAGKGHEAYQIIGEQTLNFDDREVAIDALRTRTAAHP